MNPEETARTSTPAVSPHSGDSKTKIQTTPPDRSNQNPSPIPVETVKNGEQGPQSHAQQELGENAQILPNQLFSPAFQCVSILTQCKP